MDTLSGLAVFVRAAETLSFVTAGRALGISASAVGKSIAKLEQSMGVRLFHRTTRRIALTEEGAIFFERCRHALQEIEDAQAQLSQASDAPRGRLRVSMPTIGYRLVLPVIGEFRARYPEVELDLDFSDRHVDVIEENFDVVIRGGQPADSSLKARPVAPYRFVVCASPDYFVRHGVPRQAQELSAHVCLRFKYQSSGKLQDWLIDGAAASCGDAARAPLVFNNAEAVLAAATEGLGLAYLPDFLVRQAIAQGHLQTALDASTTLEGVLRALWPANRHVPPRLRVFVDFLAERLGGTAGAARASAI
ncbi:LysR family transcriptional regulator [Trinickia dabaoshanensis]|uniref:LysR family transcriptional regulator n=1 Tax=Trinickia dabaoshanensis TaxID=564714 RepID=A0A2N7VUL6_9BURK|nr:LysR substrate-binding domain-containing protein [Trinickia dabaoshanensis]PMS20840.1 LysR family transcriptional regulator [Trinickia dabaoshanensis]